MNKNKSIKVFFILFSWGFLAETFACDLPPLNQRIFNDTPLQEMIGCSLRSACVKDMSHGALVVQHFLGDVSALKNRLMEGGIVDIMPDKSLEEQSVLPYPVSCLQISCPPLGKPPRDALKKDVSLSRDAAFLLNHVLMASDADGHIKIMPVVLGSFKDEEEWLKKNIVALHYLGTRDDIKVVTMTLDYPSVWKNIVARDLKKVFIESLENLVARDKLLIIGGGDDDASYDEHSFLAFINFLQESPFRTRFIFVGATTLTSSHEEISNLSRRPGRLVKYFVAAPGNIREMGLYDHEVQAYTSTYLAASVVSAAALALINQFPSLTIDEISSFIFASACKNSTKNGLPFKADMWGHGFLDVDSARLLCYERSQKKEKDEEEKSYSEELFKEKCQYSDQWGSVFTSPESKLQFWLPNDQVVSSKTEYKGDGAIYFPQSIAPASLFSYELPLGSLQVFYLEKSDVTKKALQFFKIEDALSKDVYQKMRGLAVGYRYYNKEKEISIIIHPSQKN